MKNSHDQPDCSPASRTLRYCSLTGLPDRKTGLRAAVSLLRNLPKNTAAAVFLLDVDDMRTYNHRLGYLAGDSFLMSAAYRLKAYFRREDLIVRTGGDQFLVVMIGPSGLGAVQRKAQSLCHLLRENYRYRNADCCLSVSVGAAFSSGASDSRQLLRQAKLALSRAKANGKNRSELYGGALEEDCAIREIQQPTTGQLTIQLAEILQPSEEPYENLFRAAAFLAETFGADQVLFPDHTGRIRRWPDRKSLPHSAEQEIPADAFQRGVFCCPSVCTLPLSFRRAYAEEGVHSTLQCLLPNGGRLRFDRTKEQPYVWDALDFDLLSLAAKLIGGYLRYLCSLAKAEQTCSEYGQVLSRIPISVYVIAREDRTLLYLNRVAEQRFPNARTGVPCHEAFMESDSPCIFCPLLKQEESFWGVVRNAGPFGERADFSISALDWNGELPAWLVTVVKHIDSENEDQRYCEDEYAVALRAAFDLVLRIEPQTGRYMLYTPSEGEQPRYGKYDETIRQNADQYVAPLFREQFLDTFLLQNLQEAFSSGKTAVQLEYEQLDQGSYRWKRRTAVPYDGRSGNVIVSYAVDITEQKHAEDRQKRVEQHLSRVFCSSWEGLAEIDANTGRYTFSIFRRKELFSAAVEGSYTDALSLFAEDRVHPDDRDQLEENFGLYSLLKAYYSDDQQKVEHIRVRGNGESCLWIELCAYFFHGEESQNILITIREITHQREIERQIQLAQRYYAALQHVYHRLYELNFTQNRYRVIYQTDGENHPIPSEGELLQEIENAAHHMVHPADSESFLELFDPKRLRQTLSRGNDYAAGEFCILQSDGHFNWFSVTVFSIDENWDGDETYLCFVMNITDQKRLEELKHGRLSDQSPVIS